MELLAQPLLSTRSLTVSTRSPYSAFHEERERCCCKLDGWFPVALLNPCGALARLIDLHLIIECLPATGGLFYFG